MKSFLTIVMLVTLGLTLAAALRYCRDPADCTTSFFAKGTHLECKP